jgi:DNA-binding beta-propeller fold protein YncE
VLRTLGTKNQAGEAPDRFNRRADVAVAPSGEIYVADGYGNSRVVKFDAGGKFVKAWGKRGKGEGEFHLPHAIFLNAARGRLYVGDRENNRVQVFDTEGKFLEQWQQTGSPYGLFLTARGQMLLADGRGSRVKLLDLMGKELAHWGDRGTGPGQFTLPHGICMDRQGAIYVTEVNIQKFVAREG